MTCTRSNRVVSLSRRLDMLETQLWGKLEGTTAASVNHLDHPEQSRSPAASEFSPAAGSLASACDEKDCRLK